MDPNLMGIFAFVLLATLIVFPFAYIMNKRVQEHAERKLALEARIAEANAGSGASAEAQRKLEARVRVLERIATDRGHDLADQIEALRTPENDVNGVPLEMRRKENAS